MHPAPRLLSDAVYEQVPELIGWQISGDRAMQDDVEITITKVEASIIKGVSYDRELRRMVHFNVLKAANFVEEGSVWFFKTEGERYDTLNKIDLYLAETLDEQDRLKWPKAAGRRMAESLKTSLSLAGKTMPANEAMRYIRSPFHGTGKLQFDTATLKLAVNIPKRYRQLESAILALDVKGQSLAIADDLIKSAYILGRQVREAEIIRDHENTTLLRRAGTAKRNVAVARTNRAKKLKAQQWKDAVKPFIEAYAKRQSFTSYKQMYAALHKESSLEQIDLPGETAIRTYVQSLERDGMTTHIKPRPPRRKT